MTPPTSGSREPNQLDRPSHGAAANAAFEIAVDDVEYLRRPEGVLLARLYRPCGEGPFPGVVAVHGGAWCFQDRTADAAIYEPLAASGVVVAAVDFRMPPAAGYPASLADVNYAVRWLKAQAAGLAVDPGRAA